MVADRPVIKPEGRGELVCIGRASAEFVEEAAPVRPSTGAEEEVPHQGAEPGLMGRPGGLVHSLSAEPPPRLGWGPQDAASPSAAGRATRRRCRSK